MNAADSLHTNDPGERALVEIDQVAYQYQRSTTPSLNGIDLTIRQGEIFGLLGPNGAGKTTLISLLAGLLPLQQGTIRFDGLSLSEARQVNPAAVSLVPQENAVYPMLTVLENLQFFAGVQNIRGALARERITEALHFCRLEQVTRKLASQLSGGLRRRLNLAIGLLGNPRLLLLDEPTVGVDPQSRHFLIDSIAALRERGVTVVYTSHYMDEVEALCDRVAIIDQGRVLVQGSLSELAAQDRDRVEFDLASPLPAALLEDLRGSLGLRELATRRYEGHLKVDELPGFITGLRTHGCELRSLAHGRQNLEQVFMRLTNRSLRD